MHKDQYENAKNNFFLYINLIYAIDIYSMLKSKLKELSLRKITFIPNKCKTISLEE